jgi:AraC-like DNA-binding protein
MNVSITIVRAIVDELRRRGISSAEYCERSSVSRAELDEATSRIPVERYEKALAAALALSADPALGLHAAWAAPAGALHVVGHLLVTSVTMREAIEHFFQFAPLILEGSRWSLQESDEQAHFVYEQAPSVANMAPDLARFDVDFCLALVLKLGFQLIGAHRPPLSVCFRHASPPYAAAYESIFQSPVRFSAEMNGIVFKRKYLDMPQTHGDTTVRDLLRQHAQGLLGKRSLVERVGDLLRTGVHLQGVDVEQLARQLGTTARSLQRHLRERGLSPTALVEDARREVACRALQGDEAIKDIAYRLGFSEPSAFHRAFKRWTGMTPAEYRRARSDRPPCR